MPITISIIVITAIVSFLGFNNEELFNRCRFNAYDVKHANQWYRFFSYGLFHAGWIHLLINMAVLYSFGSLVEKAFRYYFHSKYILYYLLLYIGALLLSVIPAYGKYKNDVFYNAVGASGAVSAVVFASILLSPLQKIYLFFIPVGIPGYIFGLLYIIYEVYMSKRGHDNIGHDAHLWGAIFGLVFTIALNPAIAVTFLEQLGLK
jgi:membrane associated rhomboid family serine protease